MAFGKTSTIKFADASYKIRCLPTKRYSSPSGNRGRLSNTEGGTVDSGAFAGYSALTLRSTLAGDSGLFGFPSPRIIARAVGPLPDESCFLMIFRKTG